MNEAAFSLGFVLKATAMTLAVGILIGVNVDQFILEWIRKHARKGLGEKKHHDN